MCCWGFPSTIFVVHSIYGWKEVSLQQSHTACVWFPIVPGIQHATNQDNTTPETLYTKLTSSAISSTSTNWNCENDFWYEGMLFRHQQCSLQGLLFDDHTQLLRVICHNESQWVTMSRNEVSHLDRMSVGNALEHYWRTPHTVWRRLGSCPQMFLYFVSLLHCNQGEGYIVLNLTPQHSGRYLGLTLVMKLGPWLCWAPFLFCQDGDCADGTAVHVSEHTQFVCRTMTFSLSHINIQTDWTYIPSLFDAQ